MTEGQPFVIAVTLYSMLLIFHLNSPDGVTIDEDHHLFR